MATTWNPLDESECTLSNGNLTASFQTQASTWNGVRATTSKTTGKYHVEFTAVAIDTENGLAFGFGNSSSPLSGFPDGFPGDSYDIASGYLFPGIGFAIFCNDAGVIYEFSSAVGDIVAAEVDVDNGLVWLNDITQGTGWTDTENANFTGNPATGSGGTSFSISGALYIMAFGQYYNSVADTIILNPGPNFSGVVSSGFSPWDAAPTTAFVPPSRSTRYVFQPIFTR